jgi:hypothetical protein
VTPVVSNLKSKIYNLQLHFNILSPDQSLFQDRLYCTVSVVDPAMPPELAPMAVVPAAIQLALPATLGALAMVATDACDELQ